jgi:vacuolar protein sorting-associated protein 13A/C
MANKLNEATEEQARTLKDLERILSFQDIRFYRSIANVKLRKQKVQIGKKRRMDAISSVTYFLKRNRKSKEES